MFQEVADKSAVGMGFNFAVLGEHRGAFLRSPLNRRPRMRNKGVNQDGEQS
ncbi:hypothetical protein I8G32_04086 [Rhodopseudomonas palustris]|jgi:hypothetical protein|nr:hypothetical protein Rpal_4479 [Rhodopseudomonas palustris TIE-1]AVT82863.1 hypothetical protein RPYSC3_40030 [Rhodopseudomonas palustris]QQM05516.1 hypothetical protein I8G32_04086 [Rhodopseudomonas palustris]